MHVAFALLILAFSAPGTDCAEPLGELRNLREFGRWSWRRLRGGGNTEKAIVEYHAGPPVASLQPPGQCVFDAQWSMAPLTKREWIAHDVLLLTFGLKDPQKPLGLSTCACLLARGPAPAAGGDAVVRPYTPVSTNAMVGAFQLMVKVYPEGAMSQHLSRLPMGASVEFKHIPFNVKVQYPFGARKIVMLVGGTGITPMLQALQALLGTSTDRSKATLLYSSKSQADILARGTLDAWEATHPRRLHVHHTLTREPEGSGWTGRRGRIDAAMLRAHLPPPSDDVLIFVCGPPAMYDLLSGPRTDKALTGLLAEMGYSARHVVKF
jgi:cytochrome-b5 reductase